MNLLLDTHVVLWWLAGETLSEAASDAIADPRNHVMVSAVSMWEISIKRALGKLEIDGDLMAAVAADFDPLDITFRHARAAGELPAHHADPFDRMLIAQSQAEELTLVSRDSSFGSYDVALLTA